MASSLNSTISGSNSLSEYYSSLSLSREFESIRVLDVENTNDTDDHEIRGSLRVVNLVDKPKFVALSYVWGTFAIPKHTISCGPYSIEVTSNCWSALYHLRQRFGAMTVWIDSICINQDNDTEKSSQIPLMSAIYSEAESVYIWLGDGTDESDIAMDYFLHAGFQDLLAKNGDVTYKIPRGVLLWKVMWKSYVRRIRHIATLRQGFCLSFFRSTLSHGARNVRTDKQLMDGVSDLLEREWSRRVWTLQEVALATQPLICCGTKILPWGSLVYGLIFLDVVSNTGRLRSLDEETTQDACYRWRRIVTLWVAIQFSRQDENETDLDDVLQRPTVPESLEEYTKFLKTTKWRYEFLMIMGVSSFVSGVIIFFYVAVFFGIYQMLLWGGTMVSVAVPGLLFAWHIQFTNAWRHPSPSIQVNDTTIREAVVQEILTRKSKNPKDKSYGIHSALSKLGVQLAAPDYSRNLSDVNRELFLALCAWMDSSSLLLLASGSGRDGQPSWVPNWDADPILKSIEWDYVFGEDTFPLAHRVDIQDHNKLILTGRKFGEVTWKCSNFIETHSSFHEEDREKHLHNFATIGDLLYEARKQSPSNWRSKISSMFKAWMDRQPVDYFLPTLLKDESDDEDEFDEENLVEFYLLEPEAALHEMETTGSRNEVIFHIFLCNTLSTTQRTLFLTSYQTGPGRSCHVGAGDCSNFVRVGNTLAFAIGIPMALVLEQAGSSCRMIGGSRIEGIMEDFDLNEFEPIVLI